MHNRQNNNGNPIALIRLNSIAVDAVTNMKLQLVDELGLISLVKASVGFASTALS